jgi:hypothetical protein
LAGAGVVWGAVLFIEAAREVAKPLAVANSQFLSHVSRVSSCPESEVHPCEVVADEVIEL